MKLIQKNVLSLTALLTFILFCMPKVYATASQSQYNHLRVYDEVPGLVMTCTDIKADNGGYVCHGSAGKGKKIWWYNIPSQGISNEFYGYFVQSDATGKIPLDGHIDFNYKYTEPNNAAETGTIGLVPINLSI